MVYQQAGLLMVSVYCSSRVVGVLPHFEPETGPVVIQRKNWLELVLVASLRSSWLFHTEEERSHVCKIKVSRLKRLFKVLTLRPTKQ